MSMSEERLLLKSAVILKQAVLDGDGMVNDSWGICSNIDCIANGITESAFYFGMLDDLFLSWPESTGISSCPVPSPTEDYNAIGYYDWASDHDAQWDLDTEYGQSRMRLLQYVIDSMVLQLGIW